MQKLSGVVITYNEEAKIRRSLRSMRSVCDEIVVVDSLSTDGTVPICREFTDRIHETPWRGYRDQKQFATDQAVNDWVLSVDADEELSPELQTELLRWKEGCGDDCDGYLIPRMAFFLGRWIRHTTWYPDWQLRLFKRSCGKWEGKQVHEGFKVGGRTGKFAGHLYHYTYASVAEYLKQLDRFSSLAAQDYHDDGKRVSPRHLMLHPSFVFFKNYILRSGFLDGIQGFVVSVLAANSTFFKYLKLWEIQKSNARNRKYEYRHDAD